MASVVKNYALATAAAVNRALGHGCAISPEAAAEVDTIADLVAKMREQLDVGGPFPGAQLGKLPWHNEQLGASLEEASRIQLTHGTFHVLVSDSMAKLFFKSSLPNNPPLLNLRVHALGAVTLEYLNDTVLAFDMEALGLLWDISRELNGHIVRQLAEQSWLTFASLPAPNTSGSFPSKSCEESRENQERPTVTSGE